MSDLTPAARRPASFCAGRRAAATIHKTLASITSTVKENQ